MRRASSNVTINSTTSQNQVFTDRDVLNVSNDSSKGKPPKRPKLFGNANRGILVTKNPPMNTKSATVSSAPATPISPTQTPSKPPIIVANTNLNDSTTLNNSTESTANTPSTSLTVNGRKNARFPTDQTLQVHTRTPPIHVKPDRRKDIKLTNCQEKDGIWTATGQFGRESRHSKRAEITYDKKKFRFIQKDDQGNKHVFEIPASDIEGKHRLFHHQTKTRLDRLIFNTLGTIQFS
jgi:hypothetical protein